MSTKSVAEKLLIEPNTTVWWSDASCLSVIEPLPEGVRTVERPGEATTALVFANDAASARDVVTAHRDQLARPATFWVAYPKANRTDINRDSLWPILAEFGMRPVGQVALDDVWSAMRVRALKDGEAASRAAGNRAAGRDWKEIPCRAPDLATSSHHHLRRSYRCTT